MNLLKQNYFPHIEMLDIGQCYDEVNSGKKLIMAFIILLILDNRYYKY